MAYIKKLVISGFKSFANKTEIPFDQGINVIIGPNGSGKSNISDALCFVLGRLSAKSMRASKSSSLIFQGTKSKKPAKEAYVDLIFDNSDSSFKISENELHIKRIVRKKGTSIYKINGETKTRQEVLEILSQGGIDPNGFNIVLQGGIARFVKMRPEERREVIEEVAGISIYEMRKQKSLHEIEKTEQKLKEVNAVLRERTAYLKNLDKERKQALRFKELQKTTYQCKASILKKNLDEKTKEVENIDKEIEKNQKYKEKFRKEIEEINSDIGKKEKRIDEIGDHIQQTTGLERDNLNDEITDLNAKIAADSARKENFEKKLSDNEIRKKELLSNIEETKKELLDLKKKSPIISKRQEELSKKKKELEKIEQERSGLLSKRTELNSLKDRIRDKQKLAQRLNSDGKYLFGQINSLSENLSSKNYSQCKSQIQELKLKIEKTEKDFSNISEKRYTLEKQISVFNSEIERNEKIKSSLPSEETCPLCFSKLSQDHMDRVISDTNKIINDLNEKIKKSNLELENSQKNLDELNNSLTLLKESLSKKQSELIKLDQISDKNDQMKKIMENESNLKEEIKHLEHKKIRLEDEILRLSNIEERYDKLFFEMQEISSRTDENLDTTILYKEREIESISNVLKNLDKDQKEIQKEIFHISSDLKENKQELTEKQKASEELNKKFKALYDERSQIQEKIRQFNALLVNKQNALSRFEDLVNQLKINQAKFSASIESYEYELKEFPNINFLQGNIIFLQEKLRKSENELATIGSVNLRALETYDKIKEEYEKIYQKVEQLEKERESILSIISEIDIKKKRTFIRTFKAINELFTENFSQLSPKGKAYLEIQNKENIFEGGIDITLRIAKGKYFDVTSLSGGEQTLVALSLIFSIQKYNPYAFYILDEIDAALDKRNSELLSNLLRKYMKSGQYIVISHNDSIISNADTLYGVSMNQGISKVVSLRLEEIEDNKSD
jgi:chromosome segregation protein